MLQSRGIKLRSLTEQVDTETATGRLMFNFLGTIAEYFLDLNRERTMEGQKAALARGRKGGRRPKLQEGDVQAVLALPRDPQISVRKAAAKLGLSVSSLYRHAPGLRARVAAEEET